MMMKNGACKDCTYKKMTDDGLSCEATTCDRAERKRLLPSGKCDDQPCADYLVLSDDTKNCLADTCKQGEIVNKDGTCTECKLYEEKVGPGRKECLKADCKGRFVYN